MGVSLQCLPLAVFTFQAINLIYETSPGSTCITPVCTEPVLDLTFLLSLTYLISFNNLLLRPTANNVGSNMFFNRVPNQLKEHTGFLVSRSPTLPAAPPDEPQALFEDFTCTQKKEGYVVLLNKTFPKLGISSCVVVAFIKV